jgi:hypothetical protein
MAQIYTSSLFSRVAAKAAAGAVGDFSIIVVMKRTSNSVGNTRYVLTVTDSANGFKGAFFVQGADTLGYQDTLTVAGSTVGFTVSDGWCAVGMSKAAGLTTPRLHRYVYSTGVATHGAGTVTVDNLSLPGPTGFYIFSRYSSAPTVPDPFTADGTYAVAALYPKNLSDAEFELAAQSLMSMTSLNPSYGMILFDQAGVTVDIANGGTSDINTGTLDTGGTAFGYGQPVYSEFGPPAASGGSGTATFTGGGVLSIIGSGSIAPPDPSPPIPVGTGWTMLSVTPAGVTTDVKFTDTGNFTHDQSRPIRRAISGFTLLPTEAAKLDLARDSIHAYLRVDEQSYPMGIFYFTESSRQKDAIIGPDGLPADLIHVSLSDQFIRLQRSDEVPRVALAGADPSQEMIRYISETDVPHSITGAENPIFSDVLWQPFTPYEAIVSQLAEIAGHRRPWADNYGVIRSVASRVVDSDIIPLEDLEPVAGTVVITENYLSAPNRVVVYDDQAGYPVVGSWDAPASAPNNATTRGWVTTAGVQAQGLSGPIHAQQVAETIGEQLSSRRLSCDIVPTNRLDGPVVLSYDNALWLVDSWSVSTKVGSTMSFDATELIISPGTES